MRIGQHRAYGYRNPGDDLNAMLYDLVATTGNGQPRSDAPDDDPALLADGETIAA